tara:strand:+ start:7851 stop:8294 length:444 start_codon:yes stop_codon:yes gene_type:complete
MRTVSVQEWQSLIPYTALSIVYWVRDRYTFNRGGGWESVTLTQWQVLFFWYPLWGFTEWVHGMQISRNSWWYIGFGTVGRTWIGHVTTVAILNDGYAQSRQQVQGYFVTLILAYIWALVGTLLYSQDEESSQVVCACNDTSQGHQVS